MADNSLLKRFKKTPTRQTNERKKHRILLVDDNEAAAQGLGSLLKQHGHDVTLAYDGPRALRVIEQFTPSVVLLDIGLPSMDGYEVAERMRAELGPTPMLIALTGYGQDGDKRRAKAAGFDHHLTKPVDSKEVEELL